MCERVRCTLRYERQWASNNEQATIILLASEYHVLGILALPKLFLSRSTTFGTSSNQMDQLHRKYNYVKLMEALQNGVFRASSRPKH
jgi:hypothetical protein